MRKVPHGERLAAWAQRLGEALAKLDRVEAVSERELDRAFLRKWPSLDATALAKAEAALREGRLERKKQRVELARAVRDCWAGVAKWWRADA